MDICRLICFDEVGAQKFLIDFFALPFVAEGEGFELDLPKPPKVPIWSGGPPLRQGRALKNMGYDNRMIGIRPAVKGGCRYDLWDDILDKLAEAEEQARLYATEGRMGRVEFWEDRRGFVVKYDILDIRADWDADWTGVQLEYYFLGGGAIEMIAKPFGVGPPEVLENYIQNPGFLDGPALGAANPGDFWMEVNAATVFCADDTTYVVYGDRANEVTINSAGGGLDQGIRSIEGWLESYHTGSAGLEPSTDYWVEAWVRHKGGTAATTVTMRVAQVGIGFLTPVATWTAAEDYRPLPDSKTHRAGLVRKGFIFTTTPPGIEDHYRVHLGVIAADDLVAGTTIFTVDRIYLTPLRHLHDAWIWPRAGIVETDELYMPRAWISGRRIMDHEDDGTLAHDPFYGLAIGGHINHIDVEDVPGDFDAVAAVAATNFQATPNELDCAKLLRLGRQSGYHAYDMHHVIDYYGNVDNTCSGGEYARLALAALNTWTVIPHAAPTVVYIAEFLETQGIFRNYVRARVEGGATVVFRPVVNVRSSAAGGIHWIYTGEQSEPFDSTDWELVDCNLVKLPAIPIPAGFTTQFVLYLEAMLIAGIPPLNVDVDFRHLLPVHETAAWAIPEIIFPTLDHGWKTWSALMASFCDVLCVFELDEASMAQLFDNDAFNPLRGLPADVAECYGEYPALAPSRTNRFICLWERGAVSSNPSDEHVNYDSIGVAIKYWPRYF